MNVADPDNESTFRPRCYFTMISGELRNRIYEYVFSPADLCRRDARDDEGRIDLLKATLPTSSLAVLLPCKTVPREALGYYQSGIEGWAESNGFAIECK